MNTPVPSPPSPVSSRTLLALTEAMEQTFDAAAWAALGLELGMPQLGDSQGRLQESLRLHDDDYGYFIAQFLRHLQGEAPRAVHDIACVPQLHAWLESNAPHAARELGLGQSQDALSQNPVPASEALAQALTDADRLLSASGAAGCADQVHTALHAYLRGVCAQAGLPVADDATIAQLFNSVRNEHPALVALDSHDRQVGDVLASLAESVTTLSRLRNVPSISGQDQVSMEDAEAMLTVNLIRTLFDYLGTRL